MVDGTGAPPSRADVAVRDGSIVAVGPDAARELPGAREIDASGHLVIPGLVDPHTHYDAQLSWQNRLTPSTMNGVTTLVVGNCGVGFAPCAPADRRTLMFLMEGVEDIPLEVMEKGLPWSWSSFPEFMDFVAARRFDADVCTQLPHSALRVFVMGDKAMERGASSEAERTRMRALVAQAVRAGAFGFSTSRSRSHRAPDGRHVPSYDAAEGELAAAADGLRDAGGGWLQLITDFDDAQAEFGMLRRLVERSGRPMTISMLQKDAKPGQWREVLEMIAQANRDGLQITGQVSTRATGVLLGFELSENPFTGRPAWKEIAALPFAQQIERLRDQQFRTRLLSEPTDAEFADRHNRWERLFPLGDPPGYEPAPEQSVAAMARREGRMPDEVAFDVMMRDGGRGILYRPMSNYAEGNLDAVREMLEHPNSLV
ncbi:MAG: amidohydrolase family protein, partial [Lautropia sp.]